jgi:hypothetical protein
VLAGSVRDMADTLRRYCSTYGLSHVSVSHGYAESFGKVITQLR